MYVCADSPCRVEDRDANGDNDADGGEGVGGSGRGACHRALPGGGCSVRGGTRMETPICPIAHTRARKQRGCTRASRGAGARCAGRDGVGSGDPACGRRVYGSRREVRRGRRCRVRRSGVVLCGIRGCYRCHWRVRSGGRGPRAPTITGVGR